MRCPKCHYLSFEPEARCRNCGYDFALAENDLVIKPVEDDDGPMQDFDLHVSPPGPPAMTPGPIHAAPPMAPARPDPPARFMTTMAPPAVDHRPMLSAAPPPRPPQPRPVRPPSTTAELPLFMQGLPADAALDAPLVQVPASPRPPLGVRRRSPDFSSDLVRADRSSHVELTAHVDSVWAPLSSETGAREPTRDPTEEADGQKAHAASAMASAPFGESAARASDGPIADDQAGLAARATAVAVDCLLLAGIDLAVVTLTARVCGVGLDAVFSLAFVPLVAFLLLVDVGYLFMFTATSGQTLGKMAAGIRVIGDEESAGDESLSLRQAVVRSIVTVPSVLTLGAGFLPALGGRGLSVHDRLSHTRVVRA